MNTGKKTMCTTNSPLADYHNNVNPTRHERGIQKQFAAESCANPEVLTSTNKGH